MVWQIWENTLRIRSLAVRVKALTEKITIIGIGDDGIEGLTQQAFDLIRSARTI
jgi:hypothetical protein